MEEPKQIFLFGAGASYGSGRCDPHPPPLGKDLFAALRPVLRCAAHIPADVECQFRSNFEAGMDALYQSKPNLIQSFQQDLARFFAAFSPRVGNHYYELIQLFRNKRTAPLLSTLNYDLLIEQALALWQVKYYHIPGMGSPTQVPVLKLHGSCNMVLDLGNGSWENVTFISDPSGPDDEIRSPFAERDVKSLTPQELHDFLHEGQSLVPCIAAYHPSKHVRDCGHAIRTIQESWRMALESAEDLFIVGVALALQDKHIWDPISSFQGNVHWVNRTATDAADWAESHSLRFDHYAASFEAFIPKYNRDF